MSKLPFHIGSGKWYETFVAPMCIYIYIYTHIFTHMYMYMCIYIYIYIHTCTHACMHAYIHATCNIREQWKMPPPGAWTGRAMSRPAGWPCAFLCYVHVLFVVSVMSCCLCVNVSDYCFKVMILLFIIYCLALQDDPAPARPDRRAIRWQLPDGVRRECTSKGIGRQGIVLKHRNSLQKEPVPCRPLPFLGCGQMGSTLMGPLRKLWLWTDWGNKNKTATERVQPVCAPTYGQYLRTKILDFRGFYSSIISLNLKGWKSHVYREFSGNLESSNLSRDNLSREIGRTRATRARKSANTASVAPRGAPLGARLWDRHMALQFAGDFLQCGLFSLIFLELPASSLTFMHFSNTF